MRKSDSYIPICPKPKTDIEWMLYRDIQRDFNHSLGYSLYQFYTSALGLNPYKTVLYNSLDYDIYFSCNENDMSINNREILTIGDRVFKKENIDPSDNRKFSEFYCDLVMRLQDELYYSSATNIERHEQLIDELLSELGKLEETLNDSGISNVRRQAYAEKHQRLSKYFDELNGDSYFDLLLRSTKDICEMIRCTIECTEYDKDQLDYFTMEVKNRISELYKVPKVNFKIDVNDLRSTSTGKSYTEIIGKLKMGKLNTEKVLQNFNYLQYDFLSYAKYSSATFEEKGIVVFEKVMKIPVEFGAWFNPEIYQIAVNNEINLNGLDYRGYTKYCRIPKKIIIGINLANIIHSGHKVASRFSSESSKAILLGYEVDSSLCDSPLIGSLEKYNDHGDAHIL